MRDSPRTRKKRQGYIEKFTHPAVCLFYLRLKICESLEQRQEILEGIVILPILI